MYVLLNKDLLKTMPANFSSKHWMNKTVTSKRSFNDKINQDNLTDVPLFGFFLLRLIATTIGRPVWIKLTTK